MQYGSLSRLAQPQSRVVCDVHAPVPAGVGAEFRGPVRGRIVLANTGAVISARGHLSATAVCECVRCLALHDVELDIEVNEECKLDQIDQPAEPLEDELQQIPILDGDAIDLTELVRQVLVLNLPPWSVCRPDCQGICPQCGRDRGTGECQCDPEPAGSLRAALQRMMDSSQS